MGLVTGNGLATVVGATKKDLLTIFIPTSPTPFTGFIIMVPKKHTIELNLSIEEALRFTVSGGVITPGNESLAALPQLEPELKPESEEE